MSATEIVVPSEWHHPDTTGVSVKVPTGTIPSGTFYDPVVFALTGGRFNNHRFGLVLRYEIGQQRHSDPFLFPLATVIAASPIAQVPHVAIEIGDVLDCEEFGRWRVESNGVDTPTLVPA